MGEPAGYMIWTGWINTTVLVFLAQHLSLMFLLTYSAISVFHLVKAPWNVSILWLCLLGFIHPVLLMVPVLAKFPVGNPAPFRKTWSHALHAIPYRMSPFYYATMGIIWLMVLFRV